MKEVVYFALLACVVLFDLPLVSAQCQGACQDIGVYCPNAYIANECPGPDNIQCCPEATPDCPGQCQDNSLDCDGNYVAGLCPGPDNVECCESNAPSPPPPPGGCASFAENEWNCADPACDSRVNDGDPQPNYECAEFVARTLAAGGLIPIDPYADQSEYGSFAANGNTYDLLWVSSKQGGPLGLEDYLRDSGWTECGSDASCVHECSALMVDGADGPYSHAVVGVADGVLDAHNMARHDVAPDYYKIDDVYNPPGNIKQVVMKQRIERETMKANNVTRKELNWWYWRSKAAN